MQIYFFPERGLGLMLSPQENLKSSWTQNNPLKRLLYKKKACYLYPGHELGPGQLIDWLTEIDISPNEKIPFILNFLSSQHVLKEPLQDLLLIIYMDWCLEMT